MTIYSRIYCLCCRVLFSCSFL